MQKEKELNQMQIIEGKSSTISTEKEDENIKKEMLNEVKKTGIKLRYDMASHKSEDIILLTEDKEYEVFIKDHDNSFINYDYVYDPYNGYYVLDNTGKEMPINVYNFIELNEDGRKLLAEIINTKYAKVQWIVREKLCVNLTLEEYCELGSIYLQENWNCDSYDVTEFLKERYGENAPNELCYEIVDYIFSNITY